MTFITIIHCRVFAYLEVHPIFDIYRFEMLHYFFSKNLEIKIYKRIIFLFVLYGCETYSLTLREECRLRVFETRILRRIFELKRDVNGEWRRLHNEELYSLYRSPNIVRVIKSRRLRWARHVVRMEEGWSAFKILTATTTGKRTLERPRH